MLAGEKVTYILPGFLDSEEGCHIHLSSFIRGAGRQKKAACLHLSGFLGKICNFNHFLLHFDRVANYLAIFLAIHMFFSGKWVAELSELGANTDANHTFTIFFIFFILLNILNCMPMK